MFTKMGYGVYFFFASLMLCSIVFVWFLIPETKGIPLESMDRLFDPSLKPRVAHKIVMAEVREDEEVFRNNAQGSNLSITKHEASHEENV
jgi:hypothetical protein